MLQAEEDGVHAQLLSSALCTLAEIKMDAAADDDNAAALTSVQAEAEQILQRSHAVCASNPEPLQVAQQLHEIWKYHQSAGHMRAKILQKLAVSKLSKLICQSSRVLPPGWMSGVANGILGRRQGRFLNRSTLPQASSWVTALSCG